MNPFVMTIFIIFSVVSLSILAVAELSQGVVSGFLGGIAKTVSRPATAMDPNYIPHLLIDRAYASQGSSELSLSTYITFNEEKPEVVTLRISSIPPGIFPDKYEKRVLQKGSNYISIVFRNPYNEIGYSIRIGIYAENGNFVAEKVIGVGLEKVYNPSELSECSSAMECRSKGLGKYCWGNALREYKCSNNCAPLLAYAPDSENCCQELCEVMLKNGICACKT